MHWPIWQRKLVVVPIIVLTMVFLIIRTINALLIIFKRLAPSLG